MPYVASRGEYSRFPAEVSMGLIMGCCPDPAECVTVYMGDAPHMAFLQFKTSKFQSIPDHGGFGPILLFLLTDEETEKLSNLPKVTSWICKASSGAVASPFFSRCFCTDRCLGLGLAWCLGLRRLRGQVVGVCSTLCPSSRWCGPSGS